MWRARGETTEKTTQGVRVQPGGHSEGRAGAQKALERRATGVSLLGVERSGGRVRCNARVSRGYKNVARARSQGGGTEGGTEGE